MAWLKFFYDAAQKGARAQRVTMPMFNAFWQQNKLIEMRRSEKNEQYIRYGDFRADPVKNALGTPSGKIEIYSRTLEKFGYKDCPAHPTWLAPDEWKGTADEKQLQLLTAHPAHRLHSQLNYAELRKNMRLPIVNQSLFTPKMLLALVLRMAIWCVSGTSAVRS